MKSYEGVYVSEEGYLLTITWTDGKLSGAGFGQSFETVRKEKEQTFIFPSKNNPLTKLVLKPGLKAPEFDLEFPDELLHFTRFNPSITLRPEELAGDYFCPELGCTYTIRLKEGELFLCHPNYPDSKLMLNGTHLKRDSWFMNH